MSKKILALFLCMVLGFSLISCSSPDKQEPSENTKKEEEQKEDDTPKPILDADATDEELLELVDEDIHVVTDDDYIETINDIKKNTDKYSGQLYQIEGTWVEKDGTSYISRTVVDGEDKKELSLPLVYMNKDLEEGAWIKVTGVINTGEVDKKTVAVLEAVVVEPLETQGQAELQEK